MSTRTQNEKKFGQWDELPGGGRRYRLDPPGSARLVASVRFPTDLRGLQEWKGPSRTLKVR